MIQAKNSQRASVMLGRFSQAHPLTDLLRLVLFFVALGAYLTVLAALVLLILNGHVRSAGEATGISLVVTLPALLTYLIFHSTSPLLTTLGLRWRYKEFGAGYALLMIAAAILGSMSFERPYVFSAVTVVMALIALVLPSLQRFLARMGTALKPVFAAVLLVLSPSAQGFTQVVLKASQLPFTLVRVEPRPDA